MVSPSFQFLFESVTDILSWFSCVLTYWRLRAVRIRNGSITLHRDVPARRLVKMYGEIRPASFLYICALDPFRKISRFETA